MCQLLVGLGPIDVRGVVEGWPGRPLEVHVRTLATTATCERCQAPAQLKDIDPVELVDLPCYGQQSRLVWHKRRWRCRPCDRTWTETAPHIAAPRHRLTDRAGRWVTEQVGRHGRAVRSVAGELGCDWHTINTAVIAYGTVLVDDPARIGQVTASARPGLSIRKHQFELASLTDLEHRGTVSQPLAAFLRAAAAARRSIVIGGGPGCGKTTLMRALLNEIEPEERLVTIEDALELGLERFADRHPNVVTLEAREPNIEGEGGISLEQLVRMGLRMDPDRVFVGEVRGSERLHVWLALWAVSKLDPWSRK